MNTVCIVGSHPDTRHLVPWGDKTKEIWVLNEAASRMTEIGPNGQALNSVDLLQGVKAVRLDPPWPQRVDAVFQMHVPAIYRSEHNPNDKGHWAWLQQEHDYPVYMQDVDPDVPSSVRYPIEEVEDTLLANVLLVTGKSERPVRYFTSTFVYAIALAILKGKQRIEIYCVEMGSGTEFEFQMPCFQFWLGIAAGRGVTVKLFSGHGHWTKLRYGYDGEIAPLDEAYMAERAKVLRTTFNHYDKQNLQLRKAMALELQGQDYDRVAQLVNECEAIAATAGQAAGALGQADGFLETMIKHRELTGLEYIVDRNACELTAAKAMGEAERLKALMHHQAGKAEYLWNVWRLTGKDDARVQFEALFEAHTQHAYDAGAMLGIYEESVQCMMAIDSRLQAAGGARALAAVTGLPANLLEAAHV